LRFPAFLPSCRASCIQIAGAWAEIARWLNLKTPVQTAKYAKYAKEPGIVRERGVPALAGKTDASTTPETFNTLDNAIAPPAEAGTPCFWVRPLRLAGLLMSALLLPGLSTSALTLAELRADAQLTPKRFVKQFADFKFEIGRVVRSPEKFLETQAGDCDDFALLAAMILREKGYTTRLVAVFMGKETHVVCYVKEANGYLDFNCRKKAEPLVKCKNDLADIAASVAESFRTQWRSVSEFTVKDGNRDFLLTEFR